VLRVAQGQAVQPSAVILDSRTLQSSPESGQRAGYDGAKRKRGSKGHIAVDTLGQLLALRVTAANEQDRPASAAPRASPVPAPSLGLLQSWASVPLRDGAPVRPLDPWAAQSRRPIRLAPYGSLSATARWRTRRPQPHPIHRHLPLPPPIAVASAHPSGATATDTSFRSTEWRLHLASPGYNIPQKLAQLNFDADPKVTQEASVGETSVFAFGESFGYPQP